MKQVLNPHVRRSSAAYNAVRWRDHQSLNSNREREVDRVPRARVSIHRRIREKIAVQEKDMGWAAGSPLLNTTAANRKLVVN